MEEDVTLCSLRVEVKRYRSSRGYGDDEDQEVEIGRVCSRSHFSSSKRMLGFRELKRRCSSWASLALHQFNAKFHVSCNVAKYANVAKTLNHLKFVLNLRGMFSIPLMSGSLPILLAKSSIG